MPFYAYAINVRKVEGKWNEDMGTGRVQITATDKETLDHWYNTVKNHGLPIEKVDSDWYLYDARDFKIQKSTNVLEGLEDFVGRVIFALMPDLAPGECVVEEEDRGEDVELEADSDEGKDVQSPRDGGKCWDKFFKR